ncbi:hypothetical protein RB195_025273 [Necator americanus]|uniref:Uncharacterized protein n=1 Tax=Necator americanus TaxID=51031 RepID=A0ABR1ERK8_NECAM
MSLLCQSSICDRNITFSGEDFCLKEIRAIINWDLFTTLASFWENLAMENIDEEHDRLVEHLHDCTKNAKSSKITKRRLSRADTSAWSCTSSKKPGTHVRAHKASQGGDKKRTQRVKCKSVG